VRWGEEEEKGSPGGGVEEEEGSPSGGVEEEEARRPGLQEEPGLPTEGDGNYHSPGRPWPSQAPRERPNRAFPASYSIRTEWAYGSLATKPNREPNKSKLYYGSLAKA